MRTIKFRGKDIENEQQWRYGSLITYPNGASVIVEFDNDGNELSYDVDADTVGQFTGLYDKNNNEIYEGDIYRYDNPDSINEVSYCTGGGFAGFDLTPAIHSENRLLDVEVIGNIHDNPELLKGGLYYIKY